ncbi:MAG TPA: methylated-DNA--[protein]-cysteine S-methyltransferase [Candidatus Aciduliprofundum boonei]|uniref:Endonuclease V n=1 Tax=Candidatus Aciduliprofundum boonei TaxID=379547 RepID=A0A7J3T8Y0_9ARCH|nr:methylated-DNA--[protein]-cysteine S-methyltransferase [Candidatus Aciduliprofundum boonei]
MDIYTYFYNLVMQIPRGMVSTYGALARALGDIRAARACGVMLSQNPDPPRIPCHRVVMSDGSIGGFTHPEGIKRKMELLRSEGVEIVGGKIVNFRDKLFEEFKTDYPLKKLQDEQIKLKRKVILKDDFSPQFVGGVDISYDGRMAYGVLAIFDTRGKLVERIEKIMKIKFPYIPTYLAFKEEPLISSLLKEWSEPLVLMVDGNGILHPRGMGLATYVGVKNDVPTIGVAKKLLMGEVRGVHIYLSGKRVGAFLKSGIKKGIYVSPGHRISLETSLKIVKEYLKYKNPEPLRIAHLFANKLRNSH